MESENFQANLHQSQNLSTLKKKLTDMISKYDGKWSVYVKDVTHGGAFAINESAMVSASLIKLFIAGGYFKNGADALYMKDLYLMISESDNDSTNRIITFLGNGDAKAGEYFVTCFAQNMGFTSSKLNRLMLEQVDVQNYTSVTDCGKVLEQILKGEYVSDVASKCILDAMKNQKTLYKIPMGLPKDVFFANKTGELDDTENDAAIVWTKNNVYIICVMSNAVPSVMEAQKHIADISRITYNYFAK